MGKPEGGKLRMQLRNSGSWRETANYGHIVKEAVSGYRLEDSHIEVGK